MGVPTEAEINPFDDLDGQAAQRHFLGKTAAEAVALFVARGPASVEDLMWMGSVAFVYYLPAALA